MIIELGILTGIVTAVMMIFKQIIPNRFMGLVSIAIGMVISVGMYHVSPELGDSLLIGLIAGLSSSGLYDAGAIALFNKTINKK
jgi:hypothetical protein